VGLLSREWIIKTLVGLGLSEVEAEVYFFLAQAGPVRGREIAKALKLYRQQVYHSLKNLQAKGMVKVTRERTNQFAAISLEKVLDQLTKEKTKQAKALQENREKLLSNWRSMIKENSATS